MLLGEAVAINLLRDQAHLYNENYTGFTFTKFDGNQDHGLIESSSEGGAENPRRLSFLVEVGGPPLFVIVA